MDLKLLEYEYPEELVAQIPSGDRGASRMMLMDRATGKLAHSDVDALPSFLRRGDLVVLNDSRVVPARLFGTRGTGEKLELLVVEPAYAEASAGKPSPSGSGVWRCLLKRSRRMRAGEKLFFGMQATATVKGRQGPYLLVEFRGESLELAMRHHGVPPLPPYIHREGFEAYTERDRERYQTVYADKPGSAAAPTAGLHLTESLLERIEGLGVETARVTLHVGIDTFTPVRAQDARDHRIHGERVSISEGDAAKIELAKRESRRVIAVGTTTTRALESAAEGDAIRSGEWTTDLYILPGFQFEVVDALLTNFHQPRSTLLAMVCAFAGRELVMRSYREAIVKRYRLFSYGDCMLIV